MAVYAYIDVSQKQEYIYRNSKMRDNLYHSFIIKAVTEELTEKSELPDKEIELGDIISLRKYLNDCFCSHYAFEYSGGGNSIIRFETHEIAEKFVKGYSFTVLKAYPDLELYISLVNEEKERMVDQYDNDRQIRELLIKRADALKDKRRSRFKRWSYGIEAIGENGQPKQIKTADRKADKEEQRMKIVRKYLFKKFENALGDTVRVTAELQDYKKEDGKSYIGVIAIDGNKMRDMVKQVNRFEDLRTFSEMIDKIYFGAIVEALQEYRKKAEAKDLLLTPVLQAGDDICLIVEAEHAIEIAAGILRKIAIKSGEDCNKIILQKVIGSGYLTACGGVALARYSYPFFELVKIAESLCHRAKENIYLVKTMEEMQRHCFIHWEVVQNQVNTNVHYERYVKDRNIKRKFHIKPLCVDQNSLVKEGIFSYEAFNKLVRAIQAAQAEKKISSSLLENLKKQMYGGIESYRLFLETNKQESEILANSIIDILCKNVDEYRTVDQYMTMVKDNDKQITYILNDVLEALPFMAKIKEGSDGAGEKLSN